MGITENIKKALDGAQSVILALKDKDTPLSSKLLALLAVGYSVSPVDIIPDVVPVVGWLDDIALVVIAFVIISQAIPEEKKELYKAKLIARRIKRRKYRWVRRVIYIILLGAFVYLSYRLWMWFR